MSTSDTTGSVHRNGGQASPLLDEVYPPKLREAEEEQVEQRRSASGVKQTGPWVGMALSGGGIRSATFCLGIFQALARERLLSRIDLLSTVSGGGYFGSFLGALFQREPDSGPNSVQAQLADSQSWPLRWLRENGRYMSPNGAGDAWLAAAVLLRNWAAVHVVLLTLVFMLLAMASLLRVWSWHMCLWCGAGDIPAYELFFAQHPFLGIWWSPFLLLPAATFALWMLPNGTLYWFTQMDGLMRCVTWMSRFLSKRSSPPDQAEVTGHIREALSRALASGFVLTIGLSAFVLIDSLGQTLYARWFIGESQFPSTWAVVSGVGMAALGAIQKVFGLVEKLPRRRALRLPINLITLGVASIWVLVIFVGLSFLAHGLAWQWNLESPALGLGTAPLLQMEGWPALLVALGVSFLLSYWFSRNFGFVNLSSQQQLYAARLKRAYLGASNPQRRSTQMFSITNPIEGDEINYREYRPYHRGGPLHLINITVNETVSGKSQIEQRDRKGVPLAVGSAGLSVGAKEHYVWGPNRDDIKPVFAPNDDRPPWAVPPGRSVEQLALGNWIAISGAAFTTGLGAGTSLGMSLLLGLANVRLGYWWDSGLPTPGKTGPARPSLAARFCRFCSRALPVQSCLLGEFVARFHGPTRRHWYLSDGGHFENTACYELLRRRVPFIICSDAGRDLEYSFADIAGLVRKARTDFKAEIEFLRRRQTQKPVPNSNDNLPALEDVVHPALLDIIGQPEDFQAMSSADEEDNAPKYSLRHALLARVHYLDTHQFSFILFLKPSLTGDEPVDLIQYQKVQPDFPQESTMDQYFDEAQWESYRKLGELIGQSLFAAPSGPLSPDGPTWAPRDLCPPPPAKPASQRHAEPAVPSADRGL